MVYNILTLVTQMTKNRRTVSDSRAASDSDSEESDSNVNSNGADFDSHLVVPTPTRP